MKQKSVAGKATAEQVLKVIRRQTRRHYSAEEKIRIVLEGLRGEENISEPCLRRASRPRYITIGPRNSWRPANAGWAGDTARAATSSRISAKGLRR
jgi:transposase